MLGSKYHSEHMRIQAFETSWLLPNGDHNENRHAHAVCACMDVALKANRFIAILQHLFYIPDLQFWTCIICLGCTNMYPASGNIFTGRKTKLGKKEEMKDLACISALGKRVCLVRGEQLQCTTICSYHPRQDKRQCTSLMRRQGEVRWTLATKASERKA